MGGKGCGEQHRAGEEKSAHLERRTRAGESGAEVRPTLPLCVAQRCSERVRSTKRMRCGAPPHTGPVARWFACVLLAACAAWQINGYLWRDLGEQFTVVSIVALVLSCAVLATMRRRN